MQQRSSDETEWNPGFLLFLIFAFRLSPPAPSCPRFSPSPVLRFFFFGGGLPPGCQIGAKNPNAL